MTRTSLMQHLPTTLIMNDPAGTPAEAPVFETAEDSAADLTQHPVIAETWPVAGAKKA